MEPAQLHDLLSRTYPHLYAEHVSRDPTTGIPRWKSYRHLEFISKKIALGVAEGNRRYIINMPPGRGKSSLISKWIPIWFLEKMPHKKVGCLSYGSELAEFWGADTRNEINTNKLIRIKLREDSQAAGQWRTPEGGGMKAAGVGGGLLGFRLDLALLDDVHKNLQEVTSPAEQVSMHDWFEHVFMTRLEPNATVVILHHRWHVKDITGWLTTNPTTKDAWEVIRLPELAEANDPLHRLPGEPLWPERWPLSSTAETRRGRAWISMYQQRPESEAGDRVYDHYLQVQNIKRDVQIRTGPEVPLALTLDFNIRPGMHGLLCQDDPATDMTTCLLEFFGPGWRTEDLVRAFLAWLLTHMTGNPYDPPIAGSENADKKYEEICDLIKGIVEKKTNGKGFPWKRVNIYGDRSGRNQSTLTSGTDYSLIAKMLQRAGVPFRFCVPYANPPVKDRVLTVNEALRDDAGRVHLHIHPNCVELVADMESQPKDPDTGLPDKTDRDRGHSGDALGYYLMWVRPAHRVQWKPQRVMT